MRKKKSNSYTEYISSTNKSRNVRFDAGRCVGRTGVTGFWSDLHLRALSEESKEQEHEKTTKSGEVLVEAEIKADRCREM